MQHIHDDNQPLDFLRVKLALSHEAILILEQFGFRAINAVRTPLQHVGFYGFPEGWSERIDDLDHGWLVDEYGFDRIQLQLDREQRCYHIVCVSARPASTTEP